MCDKSLGEIQFAKKNFSQVSKRVQKNLNKIYVAPG